MYDYKSDNKQLSTENEIGTFGGGGKISSNFKLQKEGLLQRAVNWAVNKFNMDAKNVKFYVMNKLKTDDYVALAGEDSIFVSSSHKDDKEVIKHELTHIYQQSVGSAQKSDANDPGLRQEAIEVSSEKNLNVSKNIKLDQGLVTPKENTGVVQEFGGDGAKTDNEDEVVVIRPSWGKILTSDDVDEYKHCKRIKIDDGVEEIDENAFMITGSLISNIDTSNVRKVYREAFKECEKLNNIEIPNVINIGDRAFWWCTGLSKIEMPKVTKIGKEAFRDCLQLSSVEMPNVTDIGREAFWNCTSLKKLYIPRSTKIDIRTFYMCSGLKDVELPNVTEIGQSSFCKCEILKDVKMPNVTDIGEWAFGLCKELENVKMPEVTKIGEGAFSGCEVLKNVEMPNITKIGKEAFKDCTNLKKVTLPYYCNCAETAFPSDCKVEYKNKPDIVDINRSKIMNLYKIEWIKPGELLKGVDIRTIDSINENNWYLLVDALYSKRIKLGEAISRFKINPEDLLKSEKYGFDIYDAYMRNWISYDEIKRLMPDKNIFSKMNADNDAKYYQYGKIGLEDEFKASLPNFERFSKTPENIISEFSNNYRVNTPLSGGMRSGIYQYSNDDIKGNQVLTNFMRYIKSAGDSDIKLYRGIIGYKTIDYMADMSIGSFARNNQCILGKEIFDRSFTSTTISKHIAESYTHYKGPADNENNPVILEITVPKGTSLNMMPIANENNEVVLDRFQKLRVTQVTKENNMTIINCEAIKDKDNLYKTEKDIYESSEFKKYQEEFEIDLGRYLYRSNEAYQAVQKGINMIREKNPEKNLRKIFYSNEKYTTKNFSGNVTEFGGQDLNDEELRAILRDEKPTDEDLQSSSTTVAGNLREKLGAFQFAVDDGKLSSNSVQSQGPDAFEPYIGRRDKTNEDQEELKRNFDYQDKELQLFRSARERRYQEKFRKDGKSPITYGGMLFQPQYGIKDIDSFYGKRLVAGTSGTVRRLLSRYREQVSSDKKDLLNFRLVLIACMLPERNHSLYEILQGSHEVGVIGYENLSTADTMDKTIDPLGEDKVRKNVCKDQKFPYERALEDYSKKNVH